MFVQPFYFISYYFYWIEYDDDDFFFHFQETYNSRLRERYGDDPLTLRISIRICGWRSDRSMDSIKIGCTGSPTLRPRTCGRPVVSQLLGAPNQYRAPNLRISWPWNNTQLISPRNTSNSWQIMINSTKLSWTWLHRVVLHVRPLFGRITTSLLLLLLQLRHCANLIFFWNTFNL